MNHGSLGFLLLSMLFSCSEGTDLTGSKGNKQDKTSDSTTSQATTKELPVPQAVDPNATTTDENYIVNNVDLRTVFEIHPRGLKNGDAMYHPYQITYFGEKEGLYAAQSAVDLGFGLKSNPWPGGVLPISAPNTPPDKLAMIMDACAEWSKTALVTCKMRENEAEFLRIYHDGAGCNASLGKWSFEHSSNDLKKVVEKVGIEIAEKFGKFFKLESHMNLADGCWYKGTIVHEFGHVLGLIHEHQRPNRDDFIDIHIKNIKEDKKHNLVLIEPTTPYVSDVYDFKSIMHYGPTAFSINEQKTMTPKARYSEQEQFMGNRDIVSDQDRFVMESIYGRKEIIAAGTQVINSQTGIKEEYKPIVNNETVQLHWGWNGERGFYWSSNAAAAGQSPYKYVGPTFSVFKTPGEGRTALYDCTFGNDRHFLVPDSKCNGHRLVGSIGYVYKSSNSLAKRVLYSCYNGYSHMISPSQVAYSGEAGHQFRAKVDTQDEKKSPVVIGARATLFLVPNLLSF